MAVTADLRLVNCGEGFSRSGLERSSVEEAVLAVTTDQSSVQGGLYGGLQGSRLLSRIAILYRG